MDFGFTEEQTMLGESLARTLERGPDSAALFDLGTGAALMTEEAGGFGGTGPDILMVFRTLGRAVAVTPLTLLLIAEAMVAALRAATPTSVPLSFTFARVGRFNALSKCAISVLPSPIPPGAGSGSCSTVRPGIALQPHSPTVAATISVRIAGTPRRASPRRRIPCVRPDCV